VIPLHTGSAAGTRALGEALAGLLQPGDVLLLIGGLGAGKTTFVQGLARGLGYEGVVTSPTFMLCQTYPARLDLVHVDLWRLDHTSEVLDLGLDEELEQGAVVVAEWGEGAASLLGDDALIVRIETGGAESAEGAGEAGGAGGSGEGRDVVFEPHGHWCERAAELAAVAAEATT
jgi:tRNA threonylcarbamoyladenosine biosynthesis protein TsaE